MEWLVEMGRFLHQFMDRHEPKRLSAILGIARKISNRWNQYCKDVILGKSIFYRLFVFIIAGFLTSIRAEIVFIRVDSVTACWRFSGGMGISPKHYFVRISPLCGDTPHRPRRIENAADGPGA